MMRAEGNFQSDTYAETPCLLCVNRARLQAMLAYTESARWGSFYIPPLQHEYMVLSVSWQHNGQKIMCYEASTPIQGNRNKILIRNERRATSKRQPEECVGLDLTCSVLLQNTDT